MNKKVYMAPAIEIVTLNTHPLLGNVSGIGGDTGIEQGGDDYGENDPQSRRHRSQWDDDNDDDYQW